MTQEMPFQPKSIDHVVLRVRSITRSLAFYQDVLGCTLERQTETIGLYQVRAGDTLIDLVDVEGRLGQMAGAAPALDPAEGGRNMDHFCLTIEPFDADILQAHLAQHGVEPSEIARRYGATGFGHSLYISDPDGNTIELKGPSEQG